MVDGKIYIITYKKQGNLTECIVLDIKGHEWKKIFLPVPEVSVLKPYRLFGFQDDRFYYLKENETDETWELHVEKIK